MPYLTFWVSSPLYRMSLTQLAFLSGIFGADFQGLSASLVDNQQCQSTEGNRTASLLQSSLLATPPHTVLFLLMQHGLSVCVGHDHEPCKNGSANLDATRPRLLIARCVRDAFSSLGALCRTRMSDVTSSRTRYERYALWHHVVHMSLGCQPFRGLSRLSDQWRMVAVLGRGSDQTRFANVPL